MHCIDCRHSQRKDRIGRGAERWEEESSRKRGKLSALSNQFCGKKQKKTSTVEPETNKVQVQGTQEIIERDPWGGFRSGEPEERKKKISGGKV